ncbi:MAG TPA: formate/nitrite transporter family protein [Ensifer sp.]|nr:formate/nitrite transporter family protein [Ensifer sp.]
MKKEGEAELARPASSLLWSGFAAGLSIGFSVFSQAALRHYLPDAGWRPLVECWGYAVGFLIVILARQQLFTEITLTAMLPFLAKPDIRGIFAIARLWALVFAANLAGTLIFGAAIAFDILHMPEIRAAALEIASEAMEPSRGYMFLRAIAAGWLIATVVWLLPSAESSRFPVIALLTYLIALFHLAHIVAGSVEAASLMFSGDLDVARAITHFYFPTLFGNVVGGSALFALISYAQIAEELKTSAEKK